MFQECDQHRLKVQSLMEDNARLEFEKKVHLGQSSCLEEELQKVLELANNGSLGSRSYSLSEFIMDHYLMTDVIIMGLHPDSFYLF